MIGKTSLQQLPRIGRHLGQFANNDMCMFDLQVRQGRSESWCCPPLIPEPMNLTINPRQGSRGYQVRRPQKAHLRRYVTFALPVMLTFTLSKLIANTDRVMLGGFWDATEVGYYVGVAGILRIMGEVSEAGMTLFLPQSSRDAYHGQRGIVIQRLFAAEKYLLLVMVPIAALVIFFRGPIVGFVF